MLLLVIAQQCGANTRKWQRAKNLGIPWQTKRWTSLTNLQRNYNDAVLSVELDSFDEDVALSGSSGRDEPAGDARSSRSAAASSSAASSSPSSHPPPAQGHGGKRHWSTRHWSAVKEHHLDKKTFDEHHLQFKASSQSVKCKFPDRPKYDIQVKKPNDFDLDWVYSVPCGQKEMKEGPCKAWTFLRVPEEISGDGPKKT